MEITKFITYKQTNKPIIGLDVSKNRIGVAISSPNLLIAFPYLIIKRTKLIEDFTIIQNLINKQNVWGIVVGLPLHSNGSKSKITQSINSFIKSLNNQFSNIAITTQDERYSSLFIKKNPVLNLTDNVKNIDDQSACWILQNFLDKLNNNAIM